MTDPREDRRKQRQVQSLIDGVNLGWLVMVEKMLVQPQYQAVLNRLSDSGSYVILYAAHRNDRRMIELLLRYGADPTVQSPLHHSIIYQAKLHRNRKLIALLQPKDENLEEWEERRN